MLNVGQLLTSIFVSESIPGMHHMQRTMSVCRSLHATYMVLYIRLTDISIPSYPVPRTCFFATNKPIKPPPFLAASCQDTCMRQRRVPFTVSCIHICLADFQLAFPPNGTRLPSNGTRRRHSNCTTALAPSCMCCAHMACRGVPPRKGDKKSLAGRDDRRAHWKVTTLPVITGWKSHHGSHDMRCSWWKIWGDFQPTCSLKMKICSYVARGVLDAFPSSQPNVHILRALQELAAIFLTLGESKHVGCLSFRNGLQHLIQSQTSMILKV